MNLFRSACVEHSNIVNDKTEINQQDYIGSLHYDLPENIEDAMMKILI